MRGKPIQFSSLTVVRRYRSATMKKPRQPKTPTAQAHEPLPKAYGELAGGITTLLDEARRQAARAVNAIMTATYWEIGRRIVEFEQKGKLRADYGEALLKHLASD